jgi:hypothetical protein
MVKRVDNAGIKSHFWSLPVVLSRGRIFLVSLIKFTDLGFQEDLFYLSAACYNYSS